MALVISTEPAEEPLSIEEVKTHLRVDMDDDDDLIQNLITSARQYVESYLKRSLISQTWKYYPEEWPDEDYMELPMPPLLSVTSVVYTDYNGTATTMTLTTDYVVDTYHEPGRVVLAYGQTWPSTTLTVTNPICVTFICGFGTPEDIPRAIRSAMLIFIGDLYEQRESIIVGQTFSHLKTIEALLEPYRIYAF